MKPRVARLQDKASELFDLLERTVEHKLNSAMCITWTNSFKNILEETRKSNMEKWNVADFVNLKREERNKCKSCTICGRCWLLCTSYVDIQNGKNM
jgi:hypothetical protein